MACLSCAVLRAICLDRSMDCCRSSDHFWNLVFLSAACCHFCRSTLSPNWGQCYETVAAEIHG
jgi:hypothetical protein